MNTQAREARRYHWLSEGLEGFLDSPHAAIEGRNQGAIVNLADARARHNRHAGLQLVHGGPERPIAILRRLRAGNAAIDLFPEPQPDCTGPHLHMPAHHQVLASDVLLRRLHATLAAAADRGPKDYAELLLIPGVGARTVAALAFVAEVIYGTPARFSDPARFSFAHGGKDAHPFPVALKVYDETLRVMKAAVSNARLGNSDRLSALQRLDSQARALELRASGPQFSALLAAERASSPGFGGRSVFGTQ